MSKQRRYKQYETHVTRRSWLTGRAVAWVVLTVGLMVAAYYAPYLISRKHESKRAPAKAASVWQPYYDSTAHFKTTFPCRVKSVTLPSSGLDAVIVGGVNMTSGATCTFQPNGADDTYAAYTASYHYPAGGQDQSTLLHIIVELSKTTPDGVPAVATTQQWAVDGNVAMRWMQPTSDGRVDETLYVFANGRLYCLTANVTTRNQVNATQFISAFDPTFS